MELCRFSDGIILETDENGTQVSGRCVSAPGESGSIFPSEEAATKLIWLVLRNVQASWKNPPISWHAAKAQLAIQFEQRFLLTD